MKKTYVILAAIVIVFGGFFVWFDNTPEIKQDLKEEPIYPRAKVVR